MIDIRSTLYRLEISYQGNSDDRYKVYILHTRDFIPGECRPYIYHSEFPRV
jgi:hypothetical protein